MPAEVVLGMNMAFKTRCTCCFCELAYAICTSTNAVMCRKGEKGLSTVQVQGTYSCWKTIGHGVYTPRSRLCTKIDDHFHDHLK